MSGLGGDAVPECAVVLRGDLSGRYDLAVAGWLERHLLSVGRVELWPDGRSVCGRIPGTGRRRHVLDLLVLEHLLVGVKWRIDGIEEPGTDVRRPRRHAAGGCVGWDVVVVDLVPEYRHPAGEVPVGGQCPVVRCDVAGLPTAGVRGERRAGCVACLSVGNVALQSCGWSEVGAPKSELYSPLMLIAFSNNPAARGDAIWSQTLEAPAELPMIVVLLGSPPKAAMLRRTHLSGSLLILEPIVPGVTAERGLREETQDAEPILDTDDDHAPLGG